MLIDWTNIPYWVYPLVVWTLVWKGIAWWKSARNNQLGWFVVFLVVNTAGILEIVYLIWFQRNKNWKSDLVGDFVGGTSGKKGVLPRNKVPGKKVRRRSRKR